MNWLGTDQLGRDILSRMMVGTQVILLKTRLPEPIPFDLPGGVALWGVFGSLLLGAILGLNAGYRGGWTDQGIMQVLDALIAFPRIVLYLVFITALGQGDLVVILAITVTGAPGVARLVRSLTLDIKTRDYITRGARRGAKARGSSCRGRFCPTRAARCWWIPCCASAMPSSPSARWASWGWVFRRPTRTGAAW